MKFLFLFFTAATVVMIYFMSVSGKPLKTPDTPHGILDLEFASNTQKATKVINAWRSDERTHRITAAKNNTYLDFLFLLSYSNFLFLCCRKLIVKYKQQSFIRKAGNMIATGALAAGALDVLENVGMLQSLNGNITNAISLFTFTASIIKWALVVLAILFILFMLIRNLVIRR